MLDTSTENRQTENQPDQNRLARETSPYLLQHKDNPVDWYPWGTEALERAQKEDKPILLSIGYSSCHWCHVMAHESFENPETAELMNERFVNIKVDREERPDLDVIYQSALALMGQRGGWPLTMFLTPDGKPFWGGTYFPPEPRHGLPSFRDVLHGLFGAWQDNREQVLSNVEVLSEALEALSERQSGKTLNTEMLDQVAAGMLRAQDPVHGGFRGAPKFPQVPYLKCLWHAWRRTRSTLYFDAVMTAVERMCQGGIFDHLGGGFARYSTDDVWLVPHFEKMLYDNALLVSMMSTLYRETESPLLARRVRETIDWAMREMRVEHNDGFAFAAALDADSEGAEGRFYVWTEAEVDEVLGASAPMFKDTYGISTRGNWFEDTHPGGMGGVNVLARRTPYPGDPAVEAFLDEQRQRLFERRESRPRPQRDDKVLADLNGLMIRALVEASCTFDEPDWLAAAKDAFAFIGEHLTREGRLMRTWTPDRRADQAQAPRAVLDDLAQMAGAAVSLFEATQDPAYLAQAEKWVAQADDLFWCDHDGGYCLSARDAGDVITRSRVSADNAMPNGNGTMAEVLARLYLLTGNEGYRATAQRLIDSFPAESVDAVANMPTLLNAYELLANGTVVVIAGDADEPVRELLETALKAPSVLTTVLRANGDEPAGHPAHAKVAPPGKAQAYVCQGGVCLEPVDTSRRLLNTLQDH